MSGRVGPLKPSFINTYSLDFDGVDDYVFIENGIFDATNGLTLSFWVKYDGVGAGTNWLFSNGGIGGVNSQFNTRLAPDGRWFNYLVGGSFYTGIAGLNDGNWHHLTQVIDYQNSIMHFYKDGIKSTATRTSTYSQVTWGTISTPFFPFKGQVDEVTLIGRVLTQSEITSISSKPTDLTDLSPIAWYRMGDNGSYKSPQWLLPNNENKDKVSNYSMEFDGVNDYIDLGSSSTVADGGQFSLSFWIKGNTQPIGAKYLFSADYYNLHTFWTIQNTELYWRNINNNYKLLSTNLLDGEWHHILIIWNPDGTNSTIRCFTDGVNEVNIATDFRYAPGWDGGAYQGGLQYIGNRGGGTFPGFNGSIDEFAVWDNDQSSNILSIYNGGTPTTISGAVAHYKMGEESTFSGGVWTVPDAIGTNNGTSVNMAIEDRVGSAPSSSNNALSFNMDLIDRVEDTP
jgi:hypothetical protein